MNSPRQQVHHTYIALTEVGEHIGRHGRRNSWDIDSPMIAVEMLARVEGPAHCSYNDAASRQALREYLDDLAECGICSTLRLPW